MMVTAPAAAAVVIASRGAKDVMRKLLMQEFLPRMDTLSIHNSQFIIHN